MKTNWKKVKIEDFLKRYKKPIDISDNLIYKQVTIRTKHGGVELRKEEIGKKIGTKKQFVIHTGQFLMSKIDARYGAFGIVSEELEGAIITGNFWAYVVNENIVDIDYLNQYTNSPNFYELCERASSGITHRKYLQENEFLRFEIEIPDLLTQQKIIKKNGLFTNRISAFQLHIQNRENFLTSLRQQILQDAITGNLSEKWRSVRNKDLRSQESAELLLEKIKAEKEKLVKEGKMKKQKTLPPISESEIPRLNGGQAFELPEGWVWCRLGDIAIQTGSGSTPRGGKEVYVNSGIPFIRSQNVFDSGLVFQDIAYISEEIHEKMKYTKVIPNDILLNITGGSIGRTCVVPNDFNVGNINQHVSIIRLSKLIDTALFHKVLQTSYFQEEIFKNTTGAGRQGLQKNKMDEMLLPLPPLAEQHYIVERIESLFAKLDRIKELNIENQKNIDLLNQVVLKEMFEE